MTAKRQSERMAALPPRASYPLRHRDGSHALLGSERTVCSWWVAILNSRGHPIVSFAEVLFSCTGRINRKTYWLKGVLPLVVLTLGTYTSLVLVVVVNAAGLTIYGALAWVVVIGALATLVYCQIAVVIKRFHDRNKSAWWCLIGLIPYIGGTWLFIELGFLAGTEGPNKYGDAQT